MRFELQMKPIRIIAFVLLLAVGFCGVSYSLYSERTTIGSRLGMGDVDVVFSNVYIADESLAYSQSVTANIVDYGKSIDITFFDAHPGSCVTFFYEVQNNGTVPVLYELDDSGGKEFLEVYAESDRLEAGGGTGMGMIRMWVGEDLEAGQS
ncbi:MAG: hypothetical protein EOM14_13970, partial [Clostridia bacterium]|nr:hypothetical protein [Clostridia bacterium]